MNIRKQIENYTPTCEQEENDKKIILTRILNMEDDVLTRTNEIAHFTASSWITNKERNKILLIYHNIYDSWAWTGGHVDGSDDFLGVAIREAKEETGLENIKPLSKEIASIEIIPVIPHVKRGKFVSGHLHVNITFLLEADEKEYIHIKEDENSNIGWFTLDGAIEASTEPHMKNIYKKINEKLKKYSN